MSLKRRLAQSVLTCDRRGTLFKVFGASFLVVSWLLAASSPAAAVNRSQWQNDFLTELKKLPMAGLPTAKKTLDDYVSTLNGHNPHQLLEIVDSRITLRPYRGSMVDPLAALMGGSTNSLDRARLLSALLTRANHDNRIVSHPFEPGEASTTYPSRTPAPLQPLNPEVYKTVQGEVQTLAPGMWQRLCGESQECADWQSSLPSDQSEEHVYWVQVQYSDGWYNLIPSGSQLSPNALSQARVLDQKSLADLRWTVTLKVTNTYEGGTDQSVLEVSLPAAELHGQPIGYDNIPDEKLSGFQPTLSVGGRPSHKGKFFTLNQKGKGLAYQKLQIIIKGPTEVRKYSRLLAGPFPQAKGLEMVTRGAITLSTGPVWDDHTEKLLERDLYRLANLLYAAPDQRDPSPLNMTSFSALSLLKLSRQLAGQVGLASPAVLAYQARPAIFLMRTYPKTNDGRVELFRSFDMIDPGHGFVCDECTPQLRMRAAIEQSVVDGLLEDWLMSGDGENNSSHRLGVGLLMAGAPIDSSRPHDSSWVDEYNGAQAEYRLGRTPTGMVGWRFDPGPQVVPLLSGGMGGATSNIVKESSKSGLSPLVGSIIRHATTKCGASDIAGSIILAMAGAPMTGPLLSGIVGHMCRVAEAYNKAASVLNCLEFMGNDCSATDKAKELEKMLKGLGKELAIDLALAQALDIVVGGAVEVVAPGVKGALRGAYDKLANAKVPKKPKPIKDSTGTPDVPSTVVKRGAEGPPITKISKEMEADPYHPDWKRYVGNEPRSVGAAANPNAPKNKGTDGKLDQPSTTARTDDPSTTAKTDDLSTKPKTDEPSKTAKADKPERILEDPDEFDPTVSDTDYSPPRPIPRDNSGRVLPDQPHDPKYWSVMREGKIPMGKGEAWVGTVEYGVGMKPRIVDGPYRLDFKGDVPFHRDMSRGTSGKAKGFTITRLEDGTIKPGPASKESAEMTPREKEVLKRNLRNLIVPID